MSNYLRNNDDATREPASPFRRRRLWLATGVVGLTGAVSLAGVAYATTGAVGAHRLTDLRWSTAQQVSGDDQNERDQVSPDGKGREDKGPEGGEVREVPCDEKKLVESVDQANEHGGTLKLTKDCTYDLHKFDKKTGTALPTINQQVTIEGQGATIERERGEDAFRLFRVGKDGELTLKDLTVENGTAAAKHDKHKPPKPPTARPPHPPKGPHDKHAGDGGGLLVEPGGVAVLEETTFTHNTASGNGGAIANFGEVTVEASVVDTNLARENGGGIFNAGVLTVTGAQGGKKGGESVISNNNAGKNGGGIANGTGKDKDKDKDKPKPKPKDGKGDLVGGGRDGDHDRDHDGKAGMVTVENAVIEHNNADHNGGSIFSSGGWVKITSTWIKNNTACENGGGVYADDTFLKMHEVLVEKNDASKDGGGIYNTDGKREHDRDMRDGKERDGKDHDGKEDEGGHAVITGSHILGNTAGRFGGGIFNGAPKDEEKKEEKKKDGADGEKKSTATVTLRDTTIKDFNLAGKNGGGIYNNKGTVTLTATTVTENKAHITVKGEGENIAGGIFNVEPGVVTLDAESSVTDNDPTNCAGTVEGCED